MSWKSELKLGDLPATDRLEVTCRRCGKARYATVDALARVTSGQQYLDEVERNITCADRFCRGPVRIARIHVGKMEGFVGGMA